MYKAVVHFAALAAAAQEFEDRLGLVAADDWARPTPCEGWDVRALVNHVVGGNVRYTMLLGGATADELAPTRTADHLGDDPVAAFRTTAAAVATAFGEPGAFTRVVHHPAGDRPGEALLGMRILEYAAHGWDLARAIGADETIRIDVVEYLLEWAPLIKQGRRDGFFAAPASELAPDASPQERLLHLVGRL